MKPILLWLVLGGLLLQAGRVVAATTPAPAVYLDTDCRDHAVLWANAAEAAGTDAHASYSAEVSQAFSLLYSTGADCDKVTLTQKDIAHKTSPPGGFLLVVGVLAVAAFIVRRKQ